MADGGSGLMGGGGLALDVLARPLSMLAVERHSVAPFARKARGLPRRLAAV